MGGLASHKRRHDKEVGLGCGNPIGTNMEAQNISHMSSCFFITHPPLDSLFSEEFGIKTDRKAVGEGGTVSGFSSSGRGESLGRWIEVCQSHANAKNSQTNDRGYWPLSACS